MENNDLEIGDVAIIQESFQSLLDRVRNEGSHANEFSPSIYMAPGVLRDLNPNSFNPRVVSIGPPHRQDENVQGFEKQKASYLIKLMSRINSSLEDVLKLCMEKVYASMNEIKVCYVWTTPYSDAEIAEMMVMDACFILEFISQISELDEKSYSGKLLLHQNVTRDLVLLENQIPLFFLDEIFKCTVLKFNPKASLALLIYRVLIFINPFETFIDISNISTNTHHILSLLHECYTPPDYITSHPFTSTIPSAIDLDRAGVNFKPNQDPTWLMGMEVKLSRFTCFFGSWRKPTLRMSVLVVGDFTESVFRNLIAYEQSGQTRNYVTSYAYAMHMLVNTQEDVAKLVDSGVLVNYLGSNEEAANMINSICKEVAWVDFFYVEQWKTLNIYRNGYWPKHIARMRNTYFSSPWNMIALLAGIILFALTVVQTIFTIKSTKNS
ncbi:UPF0481 protein At3g47200-like [Bidens hawaiensis]|uniref:UPF0481 protein At3g47200-like n=1 Tax=Bidens hawaiensis TaxID=980011 RepID=UPI00404A8BE9